MARVREVRWPDGWSVSIPFVGGRVGGTYYSNLGSPSAPRITLTRSWGMPGAGANAVYALVDPSSGSGAAPAGGVAGLVQDYLRRNSSPDR